MKILKIIIGIFISNIFLQATTPPSNTIVGGIALFVNGEPITLYAIQKAQKTLNTDKIRATDFLIMEKLRESEIKRLKIEVTESQLDSQISQIAQQNNMSLDEFYSAIMKEGMSLTEYRTKLKEQILTQELMRKILFSSNIGQEDELRKYYNEHSGEFMIPKEVQTIKFVSNDKASLEHFITQGITTQVPSSIAQENQTLQVSNLPATIADALIATPEKSFSQVMEAENGSYVVFYIQKRNSVQQVEFDKAKNYIAQKLIANNQEKILQDYFERVRSRSKIVFVR